MKKVFWVFLSVILLTMVLMVVVNAEEACSHSNLHYEAIDNYMHYAICDDCGWISEPLDHEGSCLTDFLCIYCGEEDYTSGHSGYSEYIDAETHQYTCELCGYTEVSSHWSICTEPDICWACEQVYEYTEDSISHWGNYHTEYDADTHWDMCDDCGRVVGKPVEHFASCSQPGFCAYCLAVYTGENVRHYQINGFHYEHDENRHWGICDDCGEVIWGPNLHYAWCDNPGVCGLCDIPFAGSQYFHRSDSGEWYGWEIDDYYHWSACETCGGVEPEPHQIVNGQCLICYVYWSVTVNPSTLTGSFTTGSPITATANVDGAYAYNYWLFNDQGVIVQEHTNTTDTSWTFTITEPGIYLLRTYATDFVVEDWADTDWFYVSGESTAPSAPAVTVSSVTVSGDLKAGASLTGTATVTSGFAFNYWLFNDQGVIVNEHTNTTDTAWNFSVATPGLYLLRVYATDFLTEDWNDSEWFYITQAAPANPVVVSSASLSEANIHVGDTMTVVPSVSGGSGLYAYNYWVFNANGVIVKEKTNTLDSSASFTFTEPGVYLIRVYATDFESEDYTDSFWFSVIEVSPAPQAEEAPQPEAEPTEALPEAEGPADAAPEEAIDTLPEQEPAFAA